MIIGIEGAIGQGKTLVMTKLLLDEYRKMEKRIYANYRLIGIPYEPLVLEEVLRAASEDQGRDFMDAALGLDEAHIWLDSRISASKMSRLLTYFTLQTGKLDVNLYYTTQDFGQVDKRLRQRTDVAITVKRRGDLIQLFIHDFTTGRNSRAVVYGPSYYQFYDTREVVKLTRAGHEKKEKVESA